MESLKALLIAVLLAGPVGLASVPAASAEPLTPLPPNEVAYLDHLHRVIAVQGDHMVRFKSDGELLDKGRYVCQLRDTGRIGYGATRVSPIISQLAFIHLCPV